MYLRICILLTFRIVICNSIFTAQQMGDVTLLKYMKTETELCNIPLFKQLLNQTESQFITACDKKIPQKSYFQYAEKYDLNVFLCLALFGIMKQFCLLSANETTFIHKLPPNVDTILNNLDEKLCDTMQPVLIQNTTQKDLRLWLTGFNKILDNHMCKHMCVSGTNVNPLCAIIHWANDIEHKFYGPKLNSQPSSAQETSHGEAKVTNVVEHKSTSNSKAIISSTVRGGQGITELSMVSTLLPTTVETTELTGEDVPDNNENSLSKNKAPFLLHHSNAELNAKTVNLIDRGMSSKDVTNTLTPESGDKKSFVGKLLSGGNIQVTGHSLDTNANGAHVNAALAKNKLRAQLSPMLNNQMNPGNTDGTSQQLDTNTKRGHSGIDSDTKKIKQEALVSTVKTEDETQRLAQVGGTHDETAADIKGIKSNPYLDKSEQQLDTTTEVLKGKVANLSPTQTYLGPDLHPTDADKELVKPEPNIGTEVGKQKLGDAIHAVSHKDENSVGKLTTDIKTAHTTDNTEEATKQLEQNTLHKDVVEQTERPADQLESQTSDETANGNDDIIGDGESGFASKVYGDTEQTEEEPLHLDSDFKKLPQDVDESNSYARDRFVEAEDSHFFAYFMTMVVLCIIGYLVFHNKQKILALAVEGRSRRGTRRRPNTSGYRKLDSNLEEAVTSTCSTSVTHVIY